MVVDLYVVRHGQTDANLCSKNGGPEIPLNETGRDQAQKLRESGLLPAASMILSSPHPRAWQTAEIATGKKPEVCRLLEERNFGEASVGKTWRNIFAMMEELRSEDQPLATIGIEERSNFMKRIISFCDFIGEKSADDLTILAFSHSSTISYLMKYLLSQPWATEEHRAVWTKEKMSNTYFNHFRVHPDGEKYRFEIISLCNGQHL